MLFIVMHKINAEIAAGGPPRKELMDGMGALIGEAVSSGMLHDGDGLRGPETRVRVRWDRGRGQRSVLNGPLTGDNELVAGILKLNVSSIDEAVQWASRYGEATGAREVDVGPVTEPWDLGIAPKPEGSVPLRVLVMRKADAASERGSLPAPEHTQPFAALVDEMKRAGVFLGAESLVPSSQASRLQRVAGKNRWTDGPFTESKELVSGYAILKIASKQDAIAWATRYAEILGDIELDVREVRETPTR
ncbi:MAG: YciI family protein [Polyangiales bacterium]